MKCLNQWRGIGRAGKDAEARYTPGGKMVCQFPMAVSTYFKTADGEEKKETEWLDVVCWGRLAEMVNERVSKGDPIYTEGRLKSRQWEHEGKQYFRNEVLVKELIFLKPGEGPQVTANAERDADLDEIPFN